MIDLSKDELYQLRKASDFLVTQKHPIMKSLYIEGKSDELELLADALLNRAKELRQQKK